MNTEFEEALWKPIAGLVGSRSPFECYKRWQYLLAKHPEEALYHPPGPGPSWETASSLAERGPQILEVSLADELCQNVVPEGKLENWPRHPPGNDRIIDHRKRREVGSGGGKLGTALEYIRHGRDSSTGIKMERDLRGGWIPTTAEVSYRAKRSIDMTAKVRMRYPQVL